MEGEKRKIEEGNRAVSTYLFFVVGTANKASRRGDGLSGGEW